MSWFHRGSGRHEERGLGDVGQPLLPVRSDSRRSAGMTVTFDSAMSLSAVWACVALRADLMSTTPLLATRTIRTPPGQPNIPDPIDLPPLLQSPAGDRVTPEEWLYMRQVALDLWGNCYGRIVARDGYGFPLQIELVPNAAVAVRYDSSGRRQYRIGGTIVADSTDVYHARAYPVAGSPLGLSVLGYAARQLGVSLAAEQFGADWFTDGAHPSSVLTTTQKLDDTAARTVKRRFMASVRGREPAVLGAGLDYKQIQVSPNESQFIETMRLGVEQICRFFKVPPEIVGASGGSTMTYSNVEQKGIDLLRWGLQADFTRTERDLSRLLPNRQQVAYDLKALLRTDTDGRYKAHAIGIAAKFFTPDEARYQEGLPPLTEAQKEVLELVPLTVTAAGSPKVLPNPAKPEEAPDA